MIGGHIPVEYVLIITGAGHTLILSRYLINNCSNSASGTGLLNK